MTKADTLAFLNDQGLVTAVHDEEPEDAWISFTVRGLRFGIHASETDPEYFQLVCSYRLQGLHGDALVSDEIALQLQQEYKVVKVSIDRDEPSFAVSAEQFIPPSDGFDHIFWRTVDLLATVGSKAYEQLNDRGADAAAAVFTAKLEQELHIAHHKE